MTKQVRLYQVENKSLSDKALDWVLEHPTLALIILGILIGLAFAIVFQIIYGVATIESGVMRNFLNNSI